jgi:hypothetical protein
MLITLKEKIMKLLKIIFASLFIATSLISCSLTIDDGPDPYYITLEEVVSNYDLWYIDYNSTSGNGDIPFLSKAFTMSFINGKLFANNNLVGIGATGNGYGIQIGFYDTFNEVLGLDHDIDGIYDFEVVQIAVDRIKLINYSNNVTYYLEGFQKENFDYDLLFYYNIEYFLQEYEAWEKTFVSEEGDVNEFDNENYLSFTPENITTFYSSQSEFGTDIDNINWSYVGDYSVADVEDYDDLKILTLNYDDGSEEEFELTVINDGLIELYHWSSGTTYEFTGNGYIQYLKTSSTKNSVRNDGRKRTKVRREIKRRHLK